MALEEFDCLSALQTGQGTHSLGYLPGDGVGQGPTGPPLAPLSTEKYLPRAGDGLVGLARKGQGGGKAMAAPVLAMY